MNIHQSGVLTQCCLVVIWLVPHETAAVSAQVLCAPFNHASVYSVTLFEATEDACVFSSNPPPAPLAEWLQSFMCYCSNMWRWNRYRNKIQHKMLTLEKKILLLGFEPETFRSQVHCSTTESSPLPRDRQPTLSCQQSVPMIGKHTHTLIKSHAIYSMLQLKICSNNYYLFSCEIIKWRNKRICFPVCFSCCSWLQEVTFSKLVLANSKERSK